MAKFWCITCQEEVEHRADYCHSRCGNDCEAICSRCNRRTLTSTLSNPHDSDTAALRWATGQAQRQMKETRVTGSIEVSVPRLDATGICYRTAYYNPADGYARFRT